MNARHKLNSANVNAVLLIGGVAGWLTGSWEVFLFTAFALGLTAWNAGDIRPPGRRT